jgi:outer membrane protein assembly factor BamA
VALGLWLLCVGICAFQIPRIVVQFKEENWHKTEEVLPITGRTLILQLNPIGEESTFNEVNLKLEGTSDSLVRLKQEYFSRGKTKAEAMNNAKVMVYNYNLLDSIVTFDEGFDINSIDAFRDQKLNLILEIPFEKPFIMERSLLEVLRNTIYRNGYRSSDLSSKTVWTFNQKGLVCLTCEIEEAEKVSDEEIVISDSTEVSKQTLDSLSKVRYKDSTAVIL